MNESSWLDKILSDPVAIATLGLALVTAILAGAAFCSIWQNRSLQIRERKERLLTEIIEWAEDVAICGLDVESTFQSVVMVDPGTDEKIMKAQASLFDSASKLEDRFFRLRLKGEYMKNTAPICGGELHAKAKELINLLEEHVKLLKLYQDIIPSGIPNAAEMNKTTNTAIQISDHMKILRGVAVKIIEEATKSKTKDIS